MKKGREQEGWIREKKGVINLNKERAILQKRRTDRDR